MLFFVFLSFFIFFLTHNSKTVQCIRTICTPNDCSTIRDFRSLGQRCNQAKIDELWLQTHIVDSFLYAILCIFTCTTESFKDRIRTFYLLNDCPISEMSIFLVRAVCEMRRASYGSKYASQAFSSITFLCAFIPALFLHFLQAHPYLQLICTENFLFLVALQIKVKQGCRSALCLMPQLVYVP